MASHNLSASTALLFCLNLLFFSLVSSNSVPCPLPPHKPSPSPKPRPHHKSCPIDTLKLGVCADLLGGLININLGKPAKAPCCSLLEGLADVDAAICICTAIKADILGVALNILVSLDMLVNYCGKKVPAGYKCA